MRRTLTCRACGAKLTGALTILSTKDPNVAAPVHRSGEPLSDPGTAWKSWSPQHGVIGDDGVPRTAEAQTWMSDRDTAPLDFVPQYWINPADVTEAVRTTKKHKRLGGCCGLAGVRGPNQVCRCGAEVGTLLSDCTTDHVFVPDPAATEWQDESGGEIA